MSHQHTILRFLVLQALPVFTFANQAGVDMLETTLVALQDIPLEKIFDDHGRKNLCSEFPQIMNQVSITYNAIVNFFRSFVLIAPRKDTSVFDIFTLARTTDICMYGLSLKTKRVYMTKMCFIYDINEFRCCN